MTFLEHVKYHGFDGVVIACIDFNEPEVVELVQSGIPIVTIDHLFNNIIAIMSDNVTGMTELTEYVIRKGHERIAYIHGEADSAVTTARLSGFYRAVEKNGIVIPDEYVIGAAYRDTQAAYRETMNLLNMKKRPTCIFYPDDFAALGGLNAIREKKLRIPEDISVAGYDGIKAVTTLEPQLTTVVQATSLIGQKAAKKLISLIEKPKTTIIEQVIIPGSLQEGKTIADLR
jgi:LacI family transcriptional regulator/LacI family purine nucleotide synthesis repressor